MQIVKRVIVVYLFLFSYISGASTVVQDGIDVVVIKKDKEQRVYRVHFNPSYAIKFKNMSYRSTNIYIKEILIKAYKNVNLNISELEKFHIFISKKQLEQFKLSGVLLLRLSYKSREYTQIIMKVSLQV